MELQKLAERVLELSDAHQALAKRVLVLEGRVDPAPPPAPPTPVEELLDDEDLEIIAQESVPDTIRWGTRHPGRL